MAPAAEIESQFEADNDLPTHVLVRSVKFSFTKPLETVPLDNHLAIGIAGIQLTECEF